MQGKRSHRHACSFLGWGCCASELFNVSLRSAARAMAHAAQQPANVWGIAAPPPPMAVAQRLRQCRTPSCSLRFPDNGHKHCCRCCRLTGDGHSNRCYRAQQGMQPAPPIGATHSLCGIHNCRRRANPGYYHCCSRCASSGGGMHTRRCQRLHAARHGLASPPPSASSMHEQARLDAAATTQVGPTTGATSAASSATSGLTGYGTGQQGANQGGHPGIFIDLTDEDDPPHSFQSLDTTVTATGNDTNMLRDTANDHHAAQPLSLPSFLQLMD